MAVIVALAVVLTSTFMSVDNLCKRGDYEAAFKRASGEEQLEVFSENVAAGVSSMAINILRIRRLLFYAMRIIMDLLTTEENSEDMLLYD